MITQLTLFLELVLMHLPDALKCMIVLWGIHLINMLSGYVLNRFGIIPRFFPSLIWGPTMAPLLHANTNHISYNSLPLFILLSTLFSMGMVKAFNIIITCIYLAGILTWLFGREGCHIGSSALVMSLMGFFAYNAYARPDITSMTILILLLYYFGSLFFSFIPTDEQISFEGHLFGLISGSITAHYGYLSFTTPIASSLASLF